MLPLLLGVAKGRERVGGLARLRNEDRKSARLQRRLAVAEFGRDIDLDRQAGETLEPVFRDQAGIVGRAAGRDRQTVELAKSNGNFVGSRTRSAAKSM